MPLHEHVMFVGAVNAHSKLWLCAQFDRPCIVQKGNTDCIYSIYIVKVACMENKKCKTRYLPKRKLVC